MSSEMFLGAPSSVFGSNTNNISCQFVSLLRVVSWIVFTQKNLLRKKEVDGLFHSAASHRKPAGSVKISKSRPKINLENCLLPCSNQLLVQLHFGDPHVSSRVRNRLRSDLRRAVCCLDVAAHV